MNPVAWLSWQPTRLSSPFPYEKQISHRATFKSEIGTGVLPILSKRLINRFLGVHDFCCEKSGHFSLYLKRTSNKIVVMATV